MIDQPFPDIEGWLAFFGEAQIPVLRHTVQELDRLRENAENVNGRIIAGVIMHDPLMTLRVLQYIESHRRKRQTTDITTIERALMMIGIEPFFRDFQNLPLVEEQLKGHPKALLGLLKVINRARKASHWAREWAISRHDLDVDEITVATLLHDIAEILMWCFAPKLALDVRSWQTLDRTLRSSVAQMEAYHVQLQDLQSRLCELWHLPELLLTLIDHTKSDNPRVKNVVLAVDLARHSANGWDDAALPDDFKAIEELLHLSHEGLMHRLGLEVPEPQPPASDQPQ